MKFSLTKLLQKHSAAATATAPEAPAADVNATVAAVQAVYTQAKQDLAATQAALEEAVAEANNATAALEAANTTNANLQAQITTLQTEAANVATAHAAALTAAQGKVKETASALAVDLVAAVGIDAAQVPAADATTTATPQEQLNAIRSELATTTDPEKSGKLAAQAKLMRDTHGLS